MFALMFYFCMGICELFWAQRALELEAIANAKQRDRACRTTTKFILVAEPVAPLGLLRHRVLLPLGRRRSVGITTIAAYLLRALGFEVNLIPQSAWIWAEMRCGGRCDRCRFGNTKDNEAFVGLMNSWIRKFSMEIASEKQAKMSRTLRVRPH